MEIFPFICVCVHASVCACPPFCPDVKYALCASSAGVAYTKFPPAEVMSPSERRLLWFCDNETPLFNGIAKRRGKKVNTSSLFSVPLAFSLFSVTFPRLCPYILPLCPLSLVPALTQHSLPAATLLPFNHFLCQPHFYIHFNFNIIFMQSDLNPGHLSHEIAFQENCDNDSHAFAVATSSPHWAGRERGSFF